MNGFSDQERVAMISTFAAALNASKKDEVYSFGRILGYQPAPTFLIERPDGSRFNWRVDLVRAATPDELQKLLHEALDSRQAEG